MMKKKLALILVMILCLSMLASCGNSDTPASNPPSTSDPSSASDSPTSGDDNYEYPELKFVLSTPGAENSGKSYDCRLFIDMVKEKSGGKITFEEYFNASLVVATANLEAIGGGMADCGTVVNLYTPSLLPLSQVGYAQPFGPTDAQMVSDIYTQLSEKHPELYQEYENNNVKVLAYKGNESYNVYYSGNVNSLDDLAGKKTGVAGVYYIPWFESINVSCVSVTGADAYQNLKNNVVDGVFSYDSFMCDYKLYEVTNTLFEANMGTRNNDVLCFNLDTWNSLAPEVQQLLQDCADKAYKEFHAWETSKGVDWHQECLDNGMTAVTLTDEDRLAWAETALSHTDTLQMWIDDVTALGYDGKAIMADYLLIAQNLGWEWSFDITPYTT